MLAKPAPKVSFTSDTETHFCGTANRDTLSNSRLHRIVVWERQWDKITTHIISHFRRESWQFLQLLCFEREFSDSDAKVHRFIKWRQGSLDNGAGAVVSLYKSFKKGPLIRKKGIFCPVILYLLQSIKNLRWYETKQWTLCLLVCEGVKWKTSQAHTSSTHTSSVCCLYVCAVQVVGQSCVSSQCTESAGGGETTYTSTCAAFLVGPLQSQGWGHYRCEPLAARHCLAISVLALYSESIEQEPH